MNKICELCKGVGWVQVNSITLDGKYRHTINYDTWKECECGQVAENKTNVPNQDKKVREWWKD